MNNTNDSKVRKPMAGCLKTIPYRCNCEEQRFHTHSRDTKEMRLLSNEVKKRLRESTALTFTYGTDYDFSTIVKIAKRKHPSFLFSRGIFLPITTGRYRFSSALNRVAASSLDSGCYAMLKSMIQRNRYLLLTTDKDTVDLYFETEHGIRRIRCNERQAKIVRHYLWWYNHICENGNYARVLALPDEENKPAQDDVSGKLTYCALSLYFNWAVAQGGGSTSTRLIATEEDYRDVNAWFDAYNKSGALPLRTPLMVLNELCQRCGHAPAQWVETTEIDSGSPRFVATAILGELVETGRARTKVHARQVAAVWMVSTMYVHRTVAGTTAIAQAVWEHEDKTFHAPPGSHHCWYGAFDGPLQVDGPLYYPEDVVVIRSKIQTYQATPEWLVKELMPSPYSLHAMYCQYHPLSEKGFNVSVDSFFKAWKPHTTTALEWLEKFYEIYPIYNGRVNVVKHGDRVYLKIYDWRRQSEYITTNNNLGDQVIDHICQVFLPSKEHREAQGLFSDMVDRVKNLYTGAKFAAQASSAVASFMDQAQAFFDSDNFQIGRLMVNLFSTFYLVFRNDFSVDTALLAIMSWVMNIAGDFNTAVKVGRKILGCALAVWDFITVRPGREAQGEDDSIPYTVASMFTTVFGMVWPACKITGSAFMGIVKSLGTIGRGVIGLQALLTFLPQAFDFLLTKAYTWIYGEKMDCESCSFGDWANTVRELSAVNITSQIIKDKELVLKIETAYRDGLVLGETIRDTLKKEALIAYNQYMTTIRDIWKLARSLGATPSYMRNCPLVIYIHGRPNTGKTMFANFLAADLIRPYSKDLINNLYVRNPTQEFWDNYKSQLVVWYDDFGQRKDTDGNPNPEYEEMIRNANICPHPLHSATLEEKGKVFFESSAVICTSNVGHVKANVNSITCYGAFARRLDVVAEVRVKDEYIGNFPDKPTTDVYVVDIQSLDDQGQLKNLVQGVSYKQFASLCVGKMKKTMKQSSLQREAVLDYIKEDVDLGPAPLVVTGVNIPLHLAMHPDVATGTHASTRGGEYNPFDSDDDDDAPQPGPSGVGSTPENKPSDAGSTTDDRKAEGNEGTIQEISVDMDNFDLAIHPAIIRNAYLSPFWKVSIHGDTGTRRKYPVDYTCLEHAIMRGQNVARAFLSFGMNVPGARISVTKIQNGSSVDHKSGTPMLLPAIPGAIVNDMEVMVDKRKKRSTSWKKVLGLVSLFAVTLTFLYSFRDKVPLLRHVTTKCHFQNMLRDVRSDEVFSDERAWQIVGTRFCAFGCDFCKELKKEPIVIKYGSSPIASAHALVAKAHEILEKAKLKKFSKEKISELEERPREVEAANISGDSFTKSKETRRVEALTDPTAFEIRNKVGRNMVHISIHCPTRCKMTTVMGVCLNERYILTSGHMMKFFDESTELEIAFVGGREPLRVKGNEISEKTLLSDEDGPKDAMVFRVPKMHSMPSIIHTFISKSDQGKFQLTNGALVSLAHCNGVLSHMTVMLDKIRAVDTPIDYMDSDTVYWLRKWYEYHAETRPGYCGSPLTLTNSAITGKIIGIHTYGTTNNNQCGAVKICREDLERFTRIAEGGMEIKMEVRLPEEIEGVCAERMLDVLPHDAHFVPLGTAPDRYITSGKSAIRCSPLFDCVTEHTTIPAALKPFIRDGEKIEPMKRALKKAGPQPQECDPDILRSAVASYKAKLFARKPETVKVFDVRTAVRGVEGDDYLSRLNPKTSAGYWWSKHGATAGKYSWIGVGDDEYIHPDLIKSVETRVENARNGILERAIWVDSLKDERRPIAKVQEGKTRVFAAAQMDYTIAVRMYFLDFAKHVMNNRIWNEIAVGINPLSAEWTSLAMHLQSKGKRVFAGDFSNYDGTLVTMILYSILDLINDFYDDGPDNAQIRRILWEDIVNSVHVCDDQVYGWTHSQPSGNPLTAIINSMYNSISMRYVFQAMTGLPMRLFNEEIFMISYGDDNVINISNWISEFFNQNVATEGYRLLGMTYTDEEKSLGGVPDYRRLPDVTFLKRHFVHKNGRWLAPRDVYSILETLNWVRGQLDVDSLTRDNIDTVMWELSVHGRVIYEQWQKSIEQAAITQLPWTYPEIPTWDDQDAVLDTYYGGEKTTKY